MRLSSTFPRKIMHGGCGTGIGCPSTLGNYTLMSRASDGEGRTQPAQHNEDHESYLIHHTLPIPVEVV